MKNKLNMREIVVMAVLSMAYAVIYIAGVGAWGIFNAIFGPIGTDIVYGIWFMAAITSMYIIRKPGCAFLGEMMAAMSEVLLGTPVGVTMLIGAAIQGASSELAFTVTGYKKYNTFVLVLAGIFPSLGTFVYSYFMYGYSHLPIKMIVMMLIVRVISGGLIGGYGGKMVADTLASTGSLNTFSLGRERRLKFNG
ncbi:MAG: ECF transporter S component [Psychrilyobacter sp.]|uniref:ECF transporter S component n=1 Tax=Psychrilyobacter sp. TaxID=2586924 RepID=UPI003C7343A8